MVELPHDDPNTQVRTFQHRLTEVGTTPENLRDLLEAVLVVGAGLELDPTLQRIVQAATTLLGARYGALGVRSPGGGLSEFVYEGIDAQTRATMGHLPEGHGLLGLLVNDPRPVRIRALDRHASSVGFPPNHPPMSSFLGVPIIVRRQAYGSIYLTEKRGAPEFTDEDEVILTALAEAAAVAIDNARLFEESRTRERWLTAVSSVNSRLLTGGSVPETLDLLVRRVRELTSAESVTLTVRADDADTVAATTDAALRIRQVVEVADLTGRGFSAVVPVSGAQRDDGDSSRVEGVLIVSGLPADPDRDPVERSWLSSMADLAAVALEFAHQQRQQRLLDVLADRDRIARDLHDNVIQRLFATGMSLQSVTAHSQGRTADILARAVEQLDRTVREIRTTIFDLQAADPAGVVGLRRRLLDVIAELTAHGAVAPTVQFCGPLDTLVPQSVHPHVEAVLREGLSNARRHAKATSIDITVVVAQEFTISITDDGIGMSGDEPRSGLANLDRRAALFGGHCEVLARAAGGTTLQWSVPVERAGDLP
ncbi:GAF domain-containing protein [Rhodococcus sp. NPDC127528]|uniref:GAF domain-containing sensor histidine kinase n=1 Tax=unclassified Rhodococcus (in: high G+C Gram-positive bacteria) TaxID=192944 RepID=UPI00362728D4